MLGTELILDFLSKEIYVITAETFSAVSAIALLIYVVKKYGASIGEFADKLNEQNNYSSFFSPPSAGGTNTHSPYNHK